MEAWWLQALTILTSGRSPRPYLAALTDMAFSLPREEQINISSSQRGIRGGR